MTIERVEIGPHVLYRGDSFEILPTLGAVDAIVADPAYGTGKLSTPGASYKTLPKRENYDWDVWDESWIGMNAFLCAAVFTPPQHLVSMLSRPNARLLAAVSKQGVCVRNVSPRYGLQPIVLLGKTPVNYGSDWIEFVQDGKRDLHPNQKPAEVMRWLVALCSSVKQVVLDPFMGSATTGAACVELGRLFVGIERDAKHFDTACRQMELALLRPQLFSAESLEKPKQAGLGLP